MLLTGAARHYGWELAPGALGGVASKGLGGAAALLLLCLTCWLVRHRAVWLVAAWWIFEELQIVLCTAAWIFQGPWPVDPGQAMCSARAGFDIGAATIVVVGLLAIYVLPVNSYRSKENEERPK